MKNEELLDAIQTHGCLKVLSFKDNDLGKSSVYMRGTRKFCLGQFFFSWLIRGGRIKVPLLAGHHWTASERPFKWRFAGVPMMAHH